uniref:RdRp n=1 Tax=Henricia sp. mitovirus 1 TaxID=2950720 RepID=A0A9N6YIY3_9VIRU|nr:TPA_asm: RdRp [Henricia sp. mitovirus 1]
MSSVIAFWKRWSFSSTSCLHDKWIKTSPSEVRGWKASALRVLRVIRRTSGSSGYRKLFRTSPSPKRGFIGFIKPLISKTSGSIPFYKGVWLKSRRVAFGLETIENKNLTSHQAIHFSHRIYDVIKNANKLVDVRGALTLARFYKSCQVGGKIDLESIIATPSITLICYIKFIRAAMLRKHGLTFKLITRSERLKFKLDELFLNLPFSHYRSASAERSGYKGEPLVKRHHRAISGAITNHPWLTSDWAITRLFREYRLKGIGESLISLKKSCYKSFPFGKPFRLASFLDGGGKIRYVALGNILWQSLLFPLHRGIFNTLRTIKEDATFDQNKIFDYINPIVGKKYYSLDLSRATDRLPLMVQMGLLFHSLPWFTVLYTYLLLSLPVFKYGKSLITYKTGQGMGMYGSFGLMALHKHWTVREAAYRCNIPWKGQYLVLGDDIVIEGEELAMSYKKLMEEQGVEIQMNKSVVPSENFSGVEFASKLITWRGNSSPLLSSDLGSKKVERVITAINDSKYIWSGRDIRMFPWPVVEFLHNHRGIFPFLKEETSERSTARVRDTFSFLVKEKVRLTLSNRNLKTIPLTLGFLEELGPLGTFIQKTSWQSFFFIEIYRDRTIVPTDVTTGDPSLFAIDAGVLQHFAPEKALSVLSVFDIIGQIGVAQKSPFNQVIINPTTTLYIKAIAKCRGISPSRLLWMTKNRISQVAKLNLKSSRVGWYY